MAGKCLDHTLVARFLSKAEYSLDRSDPLVFAKVRLVLLSLTDTDVLQPLLDTCGWVRGLWWPLQGLRSP
jgi:hypothetical protein